MQNHLPLASHPDLQTQNMRALEARLERVLTPVAPASEFRVRLRENLRIAAYHRKMHQLLVREPVEMPWGWLVGAAALGSAAGLLTILLRLRQPRLGTPTAIVENK